MLFLHNIIDIYAFIHASYYFFFSLFSAAGAGGVHELSLGAMLDTLGL